MLESTTHMSDCTVNSARDTRLKIYIYIYIYIFKQTQTWEAQNALAKRTHNTDFFLMVVYM